jgi:hypothetical protein
MSDSPLEPTQLLVFRFGAGTVFEGRFVSALERLEAGGALRIVDVIIVSTDAATGEPVAIDVRGGGAGGIVGPLLDFRLDPAARRRATKRAFGRPSGRGALVRALAAAVPPGDAIVALLIGHAWAAVLANAVGQMDGTELNNAMVTAAGLEGLPTEALGTVGMRTPR